MHPQNVRKLQYSLHGNEVVMARRGSEEELWELDVAGSNPATPTMISRT
jgi:hypothetical protein